MPSLNNVMLMGHLGAEPEPTQTPGGQVVKLRLATNTVWTDKAGARQERTDWHRVSVWGRQGDSCLQYLRRGSAVFVEGSLRVNVVGEGPEARTYCDVTARRVHFISGGRAAAGAPAQSSSGAGEGAGPTRDQLRAAATASDSAGDAVGRVKEGDIPF